MVLERELVQLGLTPDEARCYLALLGRGRLSASELTAVTGVSRGRIYDVARGLLVKGAAVDAAARVRSFEAVPASAAVANLLDHRRSELAAIESAATQLTEALAATASTAAEQAAASPVEVLRHRATVRERCHQLEADSQQEILFFIRNIHQVAGDLISETAALARGVAMRAIYESSLLQTPYVETIERFVGAGGQARHVATLPCRLTIVDGSVTLLALHEPPTQVLDFTVLAFNHEGISAVATIAFDSIWRSAAPISFPHSIAQSLPSARRPPSHS